MALLDTLVSELVGTKSVAALSKSAGADSSQVQQVVAAALPLLLSGMHQNASTEEGAASLSKAMEQHAGNAKSSTSAMLKEADADDGKKIVKHVLGDNTTDITKKLSKKSGLTSAQITTILATLAPVVLSLMGSHKQEQQADSTPSGLTGLLASALLGGSASGKSGGLDLSSVASALLGGGQGGNSDEGGLGGLLGGLLGGGGGASLASGLLGNLLGGGNSSSGSHKKKQEESDIGDTLSSLLGGLLK
ncbi:MAG: DUF937 domain-containing protein [Ruthenibacterium sp.]